MFKKSLLLNSHETGLSNRNLTPLDNPETPVVPQKPTLSATTDAEHPRAIGTMLVLVVLLHLWLGSWLLKPKQAPQTPAQVMMEVSLLSQPTPKAPVTPPAPPAPPKPEPPKKQAAPKPVQKQVKKTLPVISKPAELPKPQPIVEAKPSPPSPATPPVTPVFTPPAVSRPAPAVVSNEPKISTGVIPLERIPPKYPPRAADRHIEGWVKIEFTITTDGNVENAVVVEAEPAEIFNDAALKAINQWTFKEKIVNGVAVEQRAIQTLQFKLTR